jgi:hypothetical protein
MIQCLFKREFMGFINNLAGQSEWKIKTWWLLLKHVKRTLSEKFAALSHLCFLSQLVDKLDSFVCIVLIRFRFSLGLLIGKRSLDVFVQILILSHDLF